MRIRDIMTANVVTIGPQESIAVARERLRLRGIHHLLVMQGKQLLGALSDRDLTGREDDEPVSKAMARGLATITPSATLREAAGILDTATLGCLPVVDDGELRGIVTMRDLVRAIAKGATHASPQPERAVLRKRGPRKHHVTV